MQNSSNRTSERVCGGSGGLGDSVEFTDSPSSKALRGLLAEDFADSEVDVAAGRHTAKCNRTETLRQALGGARGRRLRLGGAHAAPYREARLPSKGLTRCEQDLIQAQDQS